MGTNALESYNLVESKGALLNIDAPRPVYGASPFQKTAQRNATV